MNLIFYRIFIAFLAFLSTISLVIIVYRDSYFYFGVIFSLLIVFVSSYLLVIKKVKNYLQRLSFAFFATLLLASGEFYLVFVESLIIKIAVAVFTNILFYIYLNEFLNLLFIQLDISSQRKRQFFLFLETPMVFFITAGFFGLRDFLNISVIWLVLSLFLLMMILTSYLFFSDEHLGLKKIYYCLITALIMGELFWSINIFPLVYYLKGFILALLYLLGMKLLISSLEGKLSKKIIIHYLIGFFIVLGGVLLTARWF